MTTPAQNEAARLAFQAHLETDHLEHRIIFALEIAQRVLAKYETTNPPMSAAREALATVALCLSPTPPPSYTYERLMFSLYDHANSNRNQAETQILLRVVRDLVAAAYNYTQTTNRNPVTDEEQFEEGQHGADPTDVDRRVATQAHISAMLADAARYLEPQTPATQPPNSAHRDWPAHLKLYRQIKGPDDQRFNSSWRTPDTVNLAREIVQTRNTDLLPILADALEEAGCDHSEVLTQLRQEHEHSTPATWVIRKLIGE